MKGVPAIVIDSNTCRVYRGDVYAELKPQEFEVFKCLWSSKGRTRTPISVYREMYQLRPSKDWPSRENLRTHICRIRRKIEPLGYSISHGLNGYAIVEYHGDCDRRAA